MRSDDESLWTIPNSRSIDIGGNPGPPDAKGHQIVLSPTPLHSTPSRLGGGRKRIMGRRFTAVLEAWIVFTEYRAMESAFTY